MNLPNWITVSRLVITAACFLCLEWIPDPAEPSAVLGWWAFGLFLFAAVTDFVDGWLARALGQVTAFGRLIDPFADKILICGAMIYLLEFPVASALMPPWLVVIVVGRELLVTTLRGMAESSGVSFPAERLGKWKMLAQCVTVSALLTLVAGTEFWLPLAAWGVWVTLVLTVLSALTYIWRARSLLFP